MDIVLSFIFIGIMKAESPVVYIMGVAGSGKSTIGRQLSVATGIPFFDGDDFHPPANKEKMKAGQPLNDDDRKGWLKRINELAKEHSQKKGAIIACSALKEKYRIVLARGIKSPVHWILLEGNFGLIKERMKSREDHFMPASLLQSQFDTLEPPGNAIVMDINKTPEQIVTGILRQVKLTPR
jgi:carbohydrate kinase (thermoresistant glucokinase family)